MEGLMFKFPVLISETSEAVSHGLTAIANRKSLMGQTPSDLPLLPALS
ncbi:MAG: hypothetical protein QOE34_1219 [Verrucomicrobiota bacterium]|jgi:hypothetical protein